MELSNRELKRPITLLMKDGFCIKTADLNAPLGNDLLEFDHQTFLKVREKAAQHSQQSGETQNCEIRQERLFLGWEIGQMDVKAEAAFLTWLLPPPPAQGTLCLGERGGHSQGLPIRDPEALETETGGGGRERAALCSLEPCLLKAWLF